MKIAIFGDSYATNKGYLDSNPYDSWSARFLKQYDTAIFAENGSSLYFSKLLFDQHHQSFDKIIFCVTAPGRVEFKVKTLESLPEYENGWYRHIPTVWTIAARLKIPELTDSDKKRYKLLHEYLLDIQDYEYEKYIHYMMINDLIRKRPDALLIPCFVDSLPDQNQGLENITRYEDNIMGWRTGFYYDGRPGHISENNASILYNIIHNALIENKTRINLDISQFEPPNISTYELLFEMKESR